MWKRVKGNNSISAQVSHLAPTTNHFETIFYNHLVGPNSFHNYCMGVGGESGYKKLIILYYNITVDKLQAIHTQFTTY